MIELRPGVPADARAMAEVHVRAWKAAYPGLVPQDYLDALRPEHRLPQWERALEAEEWPAVLVAEEGGRLLGFCSFGPAAEPGLDPTAVGEVQTIYLDPDAWARGAGRLLLEGAVDALRRAGFGRAVLWALHTNEHARGFYEHLGWRHDGATKRHDWGAFVATDVRYRRDLA